MSASSSARPPLYPVFRDLNDRLCVVVGGGAVAARKAADLLRCGARVRAVSPAFCDELLGLGAIERVAEPYDARWLEGAVVVVAATDVQEVNRRVFDDAHRIGSWVNVVDQPELCDFHVPATIRRGPIQIAVSTGGASPALARQVRCVLEQTIDDAYGRLAELVGDLRAEIRRDVADPDRRRSLLERLARADWLDRLRREGVDAVRQAMRRMVDDPPD